jgi:hypothetical protein
MQLMFRLEINEMVERIRSSLTRFSENEEIVRRCVAAS